MSICFGLASAWFGTHCGSGFATGAQATQFWTVFGGYAVFTPIISLIVMVAVAYIEWEFCRLNKTYDYRSYSNALFRPYDKVFANIYEILFIAIMVMGVSAVFAGAGQLIHDIFGIPYVLSVILVIALVVVLNMFGSGLLLKAASILSVILIIVIAIICVFGIVHQPERLGNVIANERSGSLWKAIMMGILYGSFQAIILGSTTNLSEGLETSKDSKVSAVLGAIMNGAMMILVTYMLMCYYPAVNTEQLPVNYVIDLLGVPILEPAYSVMLFLAFMTTAITCIGSLLKRFENFGADRITNTTTRRMVYSLVIIIICFCIAQFGLLNIIKRGYTAVGYLGIPFVVIPTLVVGAIKIKRIRSGNAALPEEAGHDSADDK